MRSLENLRLKKSEENQKTLAQRIKTLEETYHKKLQEVEDSDRIVMDQERDYENNNPNSNKENYFKQLLAKPASRNLHSNEKSTRPPSFRGSTPNRSRSTAKKSQKESASKISHAITENVVKTNETNPATWRARFGDYVHTSQSKLAPQKQ